MFRPLRIIIVLGWLCATCFNWDVCAQKLTIERRADRSLAITGTPPGAGRFSLQASANLDLWVDVNDQVTSALSTTLDPSGTAARYYRLIPWSEPSETYLVMLGDSTVADATGWGRSIYPYLKSSVTAVNLACPGCSSKYFLNSELHTQMKIIQPNFVLVQLGYTDTNPTDSWIGTTLPEFKTNLITIVKEIRGFDGLPILITPPVQLVLDAQGKIPVYFRDRYDLIKEVADEYKTPYIDLNRMSRDYLNQLDAKGVEAFFVSDHVHFTDPGAKVLAKFVVNGLPASMGPYLKGIFN